jgi:hypothetical protein
VARELKYSSPTMDLDALARELGGGTVLHQEDDGNEINDPYAPDDYDEDDRRR